MEPAELTILRQILGHERGGDVFALYTMAASCAQMSQQLNDQAQAIREMQAARQHAETAEAPAPSESPWTGPTDAPHEPLDVVGTTTLGKEGP